MFKPFEFPKGIRFPKPEEIPDSPEKADLLNRIENAAIQIGYVVSPSNNSGYKHYAEVNVSAPEIWAVFSELCAAIIPERSSLILGEKGLEDHELFYSPPIETQTVLSLLAPFETELSHDGHIQWGVIHHLNGRTEEIFVHATKYFTVWMNDLDAFRRVMQNHGIPESPKLSFIDEFPRVTLGDYPNRTRDHHDVISTIQGKFPVFFKRKD